MKMNGDVDENTLQRDYFGAHTFRVLPGKENAKLKSGEDIRKLPKPLYLTLFPDHSLY